MAWRPQLPGLVSLCHTGFYQKPKDTEVLRGSESGNLSCSQRKCDSEPMVLLLPCALEEVIRLCNPQDNLLHILILLILPGEGCFCWVLYFGWFLRINWDSSLWAHHVGGGLLGSLPQLSEERGAAEQNLSRAQQRPWQNSYLVHLFFFTDRIHRDISTRKPQKKQL